MSRCCARHVIGAVLAVVLLTASAGAQDIHVTQYDLAPIHLNPALAGQFRGDVRLNAVFRNQWASVPAPFNTFAVGADAVVMRAERTDSRLGAGIFLHNDVAGDSKFTTLSVMVPVGYTFHLTKEAVDLRFGVGIQAGVLHKSLQTDALFYDNQFNGEAFDPGLGGESAIDRLNATVPDLGAGFHLSATVLDRWGIDLGYATSHLIPVEQTFLSGTVDLVLQRRNSFYTSLSHRFEGWQIDGRYFYQEQGPKREHVFGSTVTVYPEAWRRRQGSWMMGAFGRWNDAVIGRVGLTMSGWTLGLAYDVNVSDLRTASNTYGAIEVATIYTWGVPRPDRTTYKRRCSVF